MFALVVAGLLNRAGCGTTGHQRTDRQRSTSARVMRKLGVESFAELVRLGTQLGIGAIASRAISQPKLQRSRRASQRSNGRHSRRGVIRGSMMDRATGRPRANP